MLLDYRTRQGSTTCLSSSAMAVVVLGSWGMALRREIEQRRWGETESSSLRCGGRAQWVLGRLGGGELTARSGRCKQRRKARFGRLRASLLESVGEGYQREEAELMDMVWRRFVSGGYAVARQCSPGASYRTMPLGSATTTHLAGCGKPPPARPRALPLLLMYPAPRSTRRRLRTEPRA